MAQAAAHLKSIDPVWDKMVRQAQNALEKEPLLGAMIHSSILHHSSLEQALSYRIALKLASAEMPEQMLREIADHTINRRSSVPIRARISWRCVSATQRAITLRNLCYSSKASRPFKPIAWAMPSGAMGAKIWPIFSNREFLKSLALIFTPRPLSDAG